MAPHNIIICNTMLCNACWDPIAQTGGVPKLNDCLLLLRNQAHVDKLKEIVIGRGARQTKGMRGEAHRHCDKKVRTAEDEFK